jgi:hypothetical protein
MAIRGWIYVLINPALEGLVKIGFSTKDPALRVRELSTTGVPRSYELAFDALVDNPREVEQRAHSRLKNVHDNKEFFRTTPSVAIQTIREIAAELKLELQLQRAAPGVDAPPKAPPSQPTWNPQRTVRRLTPSSVSAKAEEDTNLRRKVRMEEVKTAARACPHCGSSARPSPAGYCSACFGAHR